MPLPRHPSRRFTPGQRGFTVIELLTVIAVIAILAAILIPVVGGAQTSAKRAKTRVQFNQWATAIEAFRQEYGYYPNFTEFTDGLIDDATTTQQFVQTLSGRRMDGTALVATPSPGDPGIVAGNKKKIRFCSFGPDDLNSGTRLQDAFQSADPDIVVLMDKNLDGFVRVGGTGFDYAALQPVAGLTPDALPADGIRAGVIFYSAGAGQSADDIVKSW